MSAKKPVIITITRLDGSQIIAPSGEFAVEEINFTVGGEWQYRSLLAGSMGTTFRVRNFVVDDMPDDSINIECEEIEG